MSDKPDLPLDVQTLLADIDTGATAPAVDPSHLGAQFDRPALKVVPIGNQPDWADAVKTLRLLADEIESGEASPIKRCAMVIQRDNGELGINGIGPAADDLSLVALLSLGLQQIQSEMLY